MKTMLKNTATIICELVCMSLLFVSEGNAAEVKTAVQTADEVKTKKVLKTAKTKKACQGDHCDQGGTPTCTFNGKTLQVGDSVRAYFKKAVNYGETCTSELRYCEEDGSLNGSATFESCSDGTPENCKYSDGTLNHDKKATLHTQKNVPFGQKCPEVEVSCSNGKLSVEGELYSVCTEDKPKDCEKGDFKLVHQSSAKRYPKKNVAYGESCGEPVTISCYNGDFSVAPETAPYDACTVDKPKNCSADGIQLDHDAKVKRYKSATVAYGSQCEPVEVTCNNGAFLPEIATVPYKECTVSAKPEDPKPEDPKPEDPKPEQPIDGPEGKFCTYDNKSPFAPLKFILGEGQTKIMYAEYNVPEGTECKPVTITCKDGQFSPDPAATPYTDCVPMWTPSAEKHKWINIPWEPNAPTKTHAEACSAVGLHPSTKYGGCASGRVYPSQGGDWDKIHYTHGKPHIINPNGGWKRKGTQLYRYTGPIQLGMYTNKIKCVPEGKVFFGLMDDLALIWGTHDVVVAYLCTSDKNESSELPLKVVNPVAEEPNQCGGGCGQ